MILWEESNIFFIYISSFILGMRRELSYVRDGVLNKGAVDFKIPLSSDLESLHFLWWNGDFTSIVNYKIIVNIKTSDVMFQPSLNISHSGQVPKTPTYWRMSLPCSNLGLFHLKKNCKICKSLVLLCDQNSFGLTKLIWTWP